MRFEWLCRTKKYSQFRSRAGWCLFFGERSPHKVRERLIQSWNWKFAISNVSRSFELPTSKLICTMISVCISVREMRTFRWDQRSIHCSKLIADSSPSPIIANRDQVHYDEEWTDFTGMWFSKLLLSSFLIIFPQRITKKWAKVANFSVWNVCLTTLFGLQDRYLFTTINFSCSVSLSKWNDPNWSIDRVSYWDKRNWPSWSWMSWSKFCCRSEDWYFSWKRWERH